LSFIKENKEAKSLIKVLKSTQRISPTAAQLFVFLLRWKTGIASNVKPIQHPLKEV